MSPPARSLRAAAIAALAVTMLGLLAAAGAGSADDDGWTWATDVPGELRSEPTQALSARLETRELATAGDFALVAAEQDGELLIGPLADGRAQLEPLEEAAADQPLVAYSATSPDGGGQQVVGVVRADVDRVEAVLADGGVRELPLNEWRGFAYTAATGTDAAVTLVASSAGNALAAVRLPQTATRTAAAAAPSAPVHGMFRISPSTQTVTLARADARTLQPQGTGIRLPDGYGTLALSPDGSRLAIGLYQRARILIVNLRSMRVARALPLPAESSIRALAWPQPDRLIAVHQRMKGPYNRNVASRTVTFFDPGTGASVRSASLSNRRFMRVAGSTPLGLVLVLGPTRENGPPLELVLVPPRGAVRTASVPVEPRNGARRIFVLAVDSTPGRAYVVAEGGSIFDVDLETMAVTKHLVAVPHGTRVPPPFWYSQAEIFGDDLVIAGISSERGVTPTGVTLVDTKTWKSRLVDPAASNFAVLGDRLVTYAAAHEPPARGKRPVPPMSVGLSLSLYDEDARLIERVYDDRRFRAVELTPGYGHVYYNGRSTPSPRKVPTGPGTYYFGPNDQLVFGLDDGSPLGGGALSARKEPLGPPRLIFRGSTNVGEAGERLTSAPLRRTSSAGGRQQASPAGAGAARYTTSNRGSRVAPDQDRGRLFDEHGYELFLLGTLRSTAFYRIQVTPDFTCWGTGPASRIGRVGGVGCPSAIGAEPLPYEQISARFNGRTGKVDRYLRIAGIAADQAASVALVDRNGDRLATTKVNKNQFLFTPPYPDGQLRVVALDAQGNTLASRPARGQKQTPPRYLFGPRAARAQPSRLEHPVQRGAAAGIGVTVGRNGVVVADVRDIDPEKRRILGQSMSLSCFQLLGSGERETRSAGISSPWQPRIAFKLLTIVPPLDGCEAAGGYGRRWHDGRGTHSPVEIPLTDRGRRYFEQRATARDLALFVRSGKTQRIRKLTGPALIAAIRREYGNAVHILRREDATAPPGTVGVWTSGTRTVFTEQSTAGARLFVELENGKLTRENLGDLALVF